MKFTVGLASFLLLVLLAFAGHDYFDIVQISAVPSKTESKLKSHYQSLYQSKEFKLIDGKSVSLTKAKKAITIINFWASWCKPCIQEFADLNKINKKYGDDILILAINTDDENQKKVIHKSKKTYKLSFPIVADKNSKLVESYLVDSIPFSVIYINGKYHNHYVGIQDFISGEFEQLFKKAIKDKLSQKK